MSEPVVLQVFTDYVSDPGAIHAKRAGESRTDNESSGRRSELNQPGATHAVHGISFDAAMDQGYGLLLKLPV